MKIGIIAAMEEELALLLQHLENKNEEIHLGRSYYTGRIANHDIVLVQSGIGKVMSAMSVAILVDSYKVDAVINTGSAGAVAQGLNVGDVVVADRLAYHDVDLMAFGYPFGQMSGQPLFFESDSRFVTLFEKALKLHAKPNHIGLITTSDSFIASSDRLLDIKHHYPSVLAVEMEGAAVAQASYATGTPFIVVRAMSDNANNEANLSFDEFVIEAGRQSAEVLITFLSILT
ncbi:5'-methylthioadenosine/adenosylhomocysteine nucleosidase [Streptococcus fryi]